MAVKPSRKNEELLRVDNNANLLLVTAESLNNIADLLRGSTKHASNAYNGDRETEGCKSPQLVDLAKRELKQRKLQFKHLPIDFFGDAAWAMLLDLFVSEHQGKRLSTTSVCHGSLYPETTALRWLDVLTHEGFVVRQACTTDKRVKFVSLTAKGRSAVSSILHDRQ